MSTLSFSGVINFTEKKSRKFIKTCLIYYGRGQHVTDEVITAFVRYDILCIDRGRYSNKGFTNLRKLGLTLRDLNPSIEVYLYQMAPMNLNWKDDKDKTSLNVIARYNDARGHSMGDMNNDNSNLFLNDESGERIYLKADTNIEKNRYLYLMDFGSTDYSDYWLEATYTDIISQKYVADGIHLDSCQSIGHGFSYEPVDYPYKSEWTTAMNGFVERLTTGLKKHGQKVWANRGQSDGLEGFNAWIALDNSGSAPDVVMDEGAFVRGFGTDAAVFIDEARWKRQVDIMGIIKNSKIVMNARCNMTEGGSGIDNWGNPVTFNQALQYSLASFLLGKNDILDNAYFTFEDETQHSKTNWFDEYDVLDFGEAVSAYSIIDMSGTNIYMREFEKGYVLVNPTQTDVTDIPLPDTGRVYSQSAISTAIKLSPQVSVVDLIANTAAFVAKVVH